METYQLVPFFCSDLATRTSQSWNSYKRPVVNKLETWSRFEGGNTRCNIARNIPDNTAEVASFSITAKLLATCDLRLATCDNWIMTWRSSWSRRRPGGTRALGTRLDMTSNEDCAASVASCVYSFSINVMSSHFKLCGILMRIVSCMVHSLWEDDKISKNPDRDGSGNFADHVIIYSQKKNPKEGEGRGKRPSGPPWIRPCL